MMKDRITGNYRIIDSGSVILFDGKSSLKMTIEPGSGFQFTVEVTFVEDKNKERSMHKEVETDKNLIRFKCVNFDNALGTGTTTALDIANYNNKNIYFHMWSFLLGNKEGTHTRRIDYSFYIDF